MATAGGAGALVAVGILLARGPLGLAAGGVAVAIAVPVVWSVWEMLAPTKWGEAVSLIALAIGCGVSAVLAAPVGTPVARACAVVGVVILLGAPANGLVSAVLNLARGSKSSAGALSPLVVAISVPWPPGFWRRLPSLRCRWPEPEGDAVAPVDRGLLGVAGAHPEECDAHLMGVGVFEVVKGEFVSDPRATVYICSKVGVLRANPPGVPGRGGWRHLLP